jgi:alginate O-acetyltransferase complex protein AlgJ
MKKINIIIIIVFCIMLAFPLIDMNTGITKFIENSENRNREEFPDFHLDSILTFPAEFDLYFSDNFGARDLMFKLFSGFKYYFLKVSPLQEKVIAGNDSWLFLGNSYNKVIDKTIGLKKLSKKELRKISENIDSNWNALKRMGTDYYIAVPPDKHSVYNDRLPYWCRTSHPDNLFKSVQAYVDSALNFKIIDLKESMKRKKMNCFSLKLAAIGTNWGHSTLISN